jgi:hypothetical protein
MVASAGDCGGDSSGAALGARAGKGPPRPPSPSSPLPPAGSRFWALSPSDDDSDVDELASVEVAAQQGSSGGVAGRAPVPGDPRSLHRPCDGLAWVDVGWPQTPWSISSGGCWPSGGGAPLIVLRSRSGFRSRGIVGSCRFSALALSTAFRFGGGPPGGQVRVPGEVAGARDGSRVLRCSGSGGLFGERPPCPLGPRCRCRLGLRPSRSGSRPRWALWLLGLLGPRPIFLARVLRGPSVPLFLSGSGDQREP